MKVKAEINGKIVDVEVPDDFTGDQIQKELDDLHQSTRPKSGGSQRASMATPTGGRGMFSDDVRERTLGFANSMGKGVPILGNLVNKYEDSQGTPYSQDLERDYPNTAMGGRILGGVLSTAPIAGGVAGSMKEGSGLLRNMMAQGGTFGALGAADKIAEKGQDADTFDVGTAAILNTLAGMAGPVLSRVASPSLPRHVTHDELDTFLASAGRRAGAGPKKPGKITKDDPFGFGHDADAGPVFGHLGGTLEDVERQIASLPKGHPPPEWFHNALSNSLAGATLGILSHPFTGLGPELSGILGGAAGHTFGPAIRNSRAFNGYMNMTWAHDPAASAIINSLAPSVVSSVPPPE